MRAAIGASRAAWRSVSRKRLGASVFLAYGASAPFTLCGGFLPRRQHRARSGGRAVHRWGSRGPALSDDSRDQACHS